MSRTGNGRPRSGGGVGNPCVGNSPHRRSQRRRRIAGWREPRRLRIVASDPGRVLVRVRVRVEIHRAFIAPLFDRAEWDAAPVRRWAARRVGSTGDLRSLATRCTGDGAGDRVRTDDIQLGKLPAPSRNPAQRRHFARCGASAVPATVPRIGKRRPDSPCPGVARASRVGERPEGAHRGGQATPERRGPVGPWGSQ